MAPPVDGRRAALAQIALCTADLPSTIKRFVDVFHFADAGGDVLWGEPLANLQDVGSDVLCLIWWVCSRQAFFQLEFFQHQVPPSRPFAAGRAASDVGWSRFGITVPEFARTLERLHDAGIETITDPMTFDGHRRVCFRDPAVGTIVEVVEEGGLGAAPERRFDVAPTVSYATLCLADFDEGRRFFAEVMALDEIDPQVLHTEEMEALWGLGGARRDAAAFDVGGIAVELFGYSEPSPSPRPPETRIIDQGFSHVAFGFRERSDLDQLAARLEADGRTFTVPLGEGPSSTYLYGPERTPIEIFSFPQNLDSDFGFAPREVKLRPPSW